jgi:peroxin-6
MYALCADAMLKAIMRRAATVDSKIRGLGMKEGKSPGEISAAWFFDHLATEEDTEVRVTEPDFDEAKRELVASVRYVARDFTSSD